MQSCKLECLSKGYNKCPYPQRKETSAAVYIFGGSKVEIIDCEISGPVSEVRGVICDTKSDVNI